jgi:hypothetical protein
MARQSGRLRAGLLAGAIVLGLSACCPALEIVKDGKAVATVVTAAPREAPEAPKARSGKKQAARQDDSGEALAVSILVDWVRKITDAEFPVAAAAPAGAPAIYVGKAAVDAGLKLDDIDSPTHEGVRIVVESNRILIGGQSEAATVKAVCRFLEHLGCRYFMDGPLGEVYPRTATLTVAPVTITERPGLMMRNPKGPSWRGGYWKAWNGAGGAEVHHQHAWGHYVPARLFAEHPEFFAMGKDGVRKQCEWLCTSNPELRKYFAQRVIETIAAGDTHPSLSPTDGTGYCQCPACRAQDDPNVIEPSSGMVSVSKRYADFFDDVARQVAKVYPNSILSFYCYADYTQPPVLGRRLSPNLCAFIAPIRYCRLHEIGDPDCPSRLQEVQMIDGWAKLADRIGYYNYMYNLADGTLPFFKFTSCRKDFPYLKGKGLSAMTLEVLSNWHIYGPHIYLGVRLAYDPTADATAIMEDYWTKFYGPAAPHMKAYWMGLDAAVERLRCHSGGFYGLEEIYTPEFLKECQAALSRAAEAAAGDKTSAERVALHAEGLASAVEYRQIEEALARGDFAGARAVYDRMIARLQGLAAKGYANREYATAYLERFLGRTLAAGVAATAPPCKVLQVLPEKWRLAFDPEGQGVARGYTGAGFDDAAWKAVSTFEKTLSAQGIDQTTILWYRTSFDVPAGPGRCALFFGEVDGWSEVYVNGKRAALAALPAAPAAGADKGAGKGEAKRGARAAASKKTEPATPAAAPPPPASKPDTAPQAAPTVDGTPERPDANPPAAEAARPAHEGQARPRAPFEVDISEAIRPGRNVVALRVDHSRITELSLGGILRPVLLIEKGP